VTEPKLPAPFDGVPIHAGSERTYLVNEIFYSIQGEGMRAGEASVFVRFAKCNMRCTVEPGERSPGGFDCDTEFESGRRMTASEIDAEAALSVIDVVDGSELPAGPRWIILTGGEPALQVDYPLCLALRSAGWKLAIETNGSIRLPMLPGSHEDRPDRCEFPFDWIVVSPKVAEHAVRQRVADELRYVRGHGQEIPSPACRATHLLISPAFDGDAVDQRAVAWCQNLVRRNPGWRLSVQLHKLWRVR
jgi:organic radical activating enzyme